MANKRIKDLPGDATPNKNDILPVDSATTRGVTLENAVKIGRPFASQSEAEAGTDFTKAMNPLTVKQAIAAQGGAAFASAAQGVLADSAIQPADLAEVATSGEYADLSGKPTLGTAAFEDATAFATAAQGGKADTAVQPGGLASVATSGSYNDLIDKPPLDAGGFKSVSQLIADETLSYTAGPGLVEVDPGDIVDAQGFRYAVAASDATDFHVETVGGVKLYMQPTEGGFSFGALDVAASASDDSSAALQKLLTLADENRWSSVFVPTAGRDVLIDATASVINPGLLLHGNHGPGYDRGLGKLGWLLVGPNATAAFDLGSSRTTGNAADNWMIEKIGVKQATGVPARTKYGFKLTAKTNGPDRGAVFRGVSGKGLKAAIHIPNPGVSVAVANLIVENSVFVSNDYAVLSEGQIFGLRFVGNQAEQNLLGAVHGTFSSGVAIEDNMLEGQSNPINISPYAGGGNRLGLDHHRNYYESNSGDYLVKLQSQASDSLFRSGGNFFAGTHPKDDYVITSAGGWELDIHESNQYNGLTFDQFSGAVRRGSHYLHNAYYKIRRTAGLGSKWLSNLIELPSATGDYASAVPASGETRQTIFGGLVFSTGATFLSIPLVVTAGDLVSVNLLCHAPVAFTASSMQVYNQSATVVLAEQGSMTFSAGPLAVVAFDFVAAASATSINIRAFGAPATFGITGGAARNYGAHVNDGTEVKQIFPVCPAPKRAP